MSTHPNGVYLQDDVWYRGYQGIRGIVDASIADLGMEYWSNGVVECCGLCVASFPSPRRLCYVIARRLKTDEAISLKACGFHKLLK